MSNTIRVAAAQFHVGNDIDRNLATCLRMMRKAGEQNPDLLVMPEFSNHCSWYNDAQHCFEVSVDLDGEFLAAIADCVREIDAHVVINCTVRRDGNRVTGTSIMFAPGGEILGTTDKQVLIGHENDFLERATEAGPVMETPLGRLAMYSCMDGVINETPRCLALRGAQVLCNSLNSFAIDEGSLHIPVRAAENKVWVVAANKVGPLIPEELVAPVSEATNIPAHFLDGAGDSQIVAPDGTVLAIAGNGEEIVCADIDPSLADSKQRPDGTDVFAARRPALYASLAEDPASQDISISGPEDVLAAAVSVPGNGDCAYQDVLEMLATVLKTGAKLICLPEGFCGNSNVEEAAAHADGIAAAISGDAIVACSLLRVVDDTPALCGLLINKDGVVLEQPLLHESGRHASAGGLSELQTLDSEFGRIAVICGDDAIYPETFRLAALQGVSTVLVPADPLEGWECQTGIVERAAENRVNVILASSAGGERGSVIASLQKDFTIMTEWRDREFDGLLSCPEVIREIDDSGILSSIIHPLAASNKECSRNTHLIASRPWNIMQAMVS